MQPVSRRFLAGLAGARWLPRVQWSGDGGASWADATYLGGSVEADVSSQTRWSASLQLAGVDVARDGFSLFGTRLRVSLGLVFGADDIEWVPLGTYVFGDDDLTRHRDGTIDVSGVSLEQLLIDDRFLAPRVFTRMTGELLTARLISESAPGAPVAWRVDDMALPALIEERDRWGLVDGRTESPSIARALGARCFCDGRGVFVMAPVPTLAGEPVWSVTDGTDGVLVDLTETLSAAGVHNIVSVRGVGDDGKPAIGPVVLADTDPHSPTRISLRRKPLFYASPMIRNVSQANTTAAGMLAPNLGFRQQISLTSVLNPALEVGDIIAVSMLDGSAQLHICDHISFGLEAGTMTITGRAAGYALVGQPLDLSALYGQDVDDSGIDQTGNL